VAAENRELRGGEPNVAVSPPERTSVTRAGLDRRTLLTAILAIGGAKAVATAPSAAKPAEKSLDAGTFHDLFVAINGLAPRDPSLSEAFFESFKEELADLKLLCDIVLQSPESEWPTRISAAKLDALAESLILAGYTGTVGEGSNAKVITYLDAFVWYACGYTKPPSQCDWNFGAWAVAPDKGLFEP
jgi:hypothetical protein